MNDVPQSGPERDRYAIKVMQGVERDERGLATNLEQSYLRGSQWEACYGSWNWSEFDYRIAEPEVAMWANVYTDNNIGEFYDTPLGIRNGKDIDHRIKRTTGGGRTIPQYEAVPLDDK